MDREYCIKCLHSKIPKLMVRCIRETPRSMDLFVIILKFPLKCYLLKQIFHSYKIHGGESIGLNLKFQFVYTLSGSRLYETVNENVEFTHRLIDFMSSVSIICRNQETKEGIYGAKFCTFVKV